MLSDTQITINALSAAWKNIAPFWPLNNLIAVNPLQGLEALPFEEAVIKGQKYFQQSTLPKKMEAINRETIKWCQAFFDEGQAAITMPFRNQGFYQAWRQLVRFDKRLHCFNQAHRIWLENLPPSSEKTIAECLTKLAIPVEHSSLFLTLLLTTLPGWASFIKYKTDWHQTNPIAANPVTQADYLAIRLVITCLLWPNAIELLSWYQNQPADTTTSELIKKISLAEKNYQSPLLQSLSQKARQNKIKNTPACAQLVFCIDVRSEPFRRALEAQGNYETYGFAGFFGIPIQIKNELTEKSYASCPVLIAPKHTIKETVFCSTHLSKKLLNRKKQIRRVKQLYQALKYTFTTPFALAEALGPFSGLSMLLRTLAPITATQIKKKFFDCFHLSALVKPILPTENTVNGIHFNDQCTYAESALRLIGLTHTFSPLVIFCGHGSAAENNAYQSALDCGACGGHDGAANARILAEILNNNDVRNYLAKQAILIPEKTRFIAALHNTTVDDVTFYLNKNESETPELIQLKHDLKKARTINNRWRSQQLGYISSKKNKTNYVGYIENRSSDWSQTRPEWGLARNAAFIAAPRFLTQHLDLEGRAFLHSYDFEQDKKGDSLTTILTAPMIVAQWINSQYLFSLIDNVAYGSGNKITHNITGKIGIIQGNGSDLMSGLPLQSVYTSEQQSYHEPVRLLTIVYAPRLFVSRIILERDLLKKLFANGWISLACIEPGSGDLYRLQRNLTWKKTQEYTAQDSRDVSKQ